MQGLEPEAHQLKSTRKQTRIRYHDRLLDRPGADIITRLVNCVEAHTAGWLSGASLSHPFLEESLEQLRGWAKCDDPIGHLTCVLLEEHTQFRCFVDPSSSSPNNISFG